MEAYSIRSSTLSQRISESLKFLRGASWPLEGVLKRRNLTEEFEGAIDGLSHLIGGTIKFGMNLLNESLSDGYVAEEMLEKMAATVQELIENPDVELEKRSQPIFDPTKIIESTAKALKEAGDVLGPIWDIEALDSEDEGRGSAFLALIYGTEKYCSLLLRRSTADLVVIKEE